jgi:hypothetical protein
MIERSGVFLTDNRQANHGDVSTVIRLKLTVYIVTDTVYSPIGRDNYYHHLINLLMCIEEKSSQSDQDRTGHRVAYRCVDNCGIKSTG